MTWEIKYTDEAVGYLFDSWPLVESLFQVIETLYFSDDSLSLGEFAADCIEIEPNLFRWSVERHQVYFRRLEQEHHIRILALIPD